MEKYRILPAGITAREYVSAKARRIRAVERFEFQMQTQAFDKAMKNIEPTPQPLSYELPVSSGEKSNARTKGLNDELLRSLKPTVDGFRGDLRITELAYKGIEHEAVKRIVLGRYRASFTAALGNADMDFRMLSEADYNNPTTVEDIRGLNGLIARFDAGEIPVDKPGATITPGSRFIAELFHRPEDQATSSPPSR